MKEIRNLLNEISVQEYLQLLNTQGFQKDSKEIKAFIDILDSMDQRYNDIFTELQEMKRNIQQLQNPQTKTFASKAVETVEFQIKHCKAQIADMKSYIKDVAKQSLQTFKSKGKEALVESVKALQIKPMMMRIHKSLYFSLNQINVCIGKVNYMTSEVRQAKKHLKNFSFLMFGKQPPIYPNDMMKLNVIQRLLGTMKINTEKMITKTSKTIHQLDNFEKGSVKADLKMLGNKEQDKMDKQLPTKKLEHKQSR